LLSIITRTETEGPPTSITLFTPWGSNLITKARISMTCHIFILASFHMYN
jgi:hypothetical protein